MGCIQQNKSININPISNNNISLKNELNYKKNNNIKNFNKYKINYNNIQNYKFKKKQFKIPMIDKITNNKWLKILDYLNYNDLKEVGKVNKFFNNNVKNKDILLKFFQKRKSFNSNNSSILENKPTLYTTNQINYMKNDLSFSILQQQNSLYIDDDYKEEN